MGRKRSVLVISACALLALAGLSSGAAEWRADLAGVEIPEQPVAGRLFGEDFEVDSAVLRGDILELGQGEGFVADKALTLFLFAGPGQAAAGRTYEVTKEGGAGTPHVHMRARAEGEDTPRTGVLTSGYAMRLALGETAGGKAEGRIYLCLPDEQKSFVAGRFTADVETAENTGSAGEAEPPGPAMSASTPAFVPPRLPPAALALMVVGGVISTVGGIWFVVAAFRAHVLWGLACLFLPFAQLVFLIVHWRRAVKPFLVGLVGSGLIVGGLLLAFKSVAPSLPALLRMIREHPGMVQGDIVPGEDTEGPPPVEARQDATWNDGDSMDAVPLGEANPVRVGASLEAAVERLGRPAGKLLQGSRTILQYPDFMLVSEDGKTVSAIVYRHEE